MGSQTTFTAMVGRGSCNVNLSKGAFKNYVDHFLTYFDHLSMVDMFTK